MRDLRFRIFIGLRHSDKRGCKIRRVLSVTSARYQCCVYAKLLSRLKGPRMLFRVKRCFIFGNGWYIAGNDNVFFRGAFPQLTALCRSVLHYHLGHSTFGTTGKNQFQTHPNIYPAIFFLQVLDYEIPSALWSQPKTFSKPEELPTENSARRRFSECNPDWHLQSVSSKCI